MQVTRDHVFDQWKFAETGDIPKIPGCGYPGDADTKVRRICIQKLMSELHIRVAPCLFMRTSLSSYCATTHSSVIHTSDPTSWTARTHTIHFAPHQAWLERVVDPVFGFPGAVRFSWSTTRKLIEENCALVSWEVRLPPLFCIWLTSGLKNHVEMF